MLIEILYTISVILLYGIVLKIVRDLNKFPVKEEIVIASALTFIWPFWLPCYFSCRVWSTPRISAFIDRIMR
jgi:hypothetical protein